MVDSQRAKVEITADSQNPAVLIPNLLENSVEQAASAFAVDDAEKVSSYLNSHKSLLALIFRTQEDLKSEFGSEAACWLTLIEYTEAGSEPVLSIDVEAPAGKHSAYSDRMRSFKSSWRRSLTVEESSMLTMSVRYM